MNSFQHCSLSSWPRFIFMLWKFFSLTYWWVIETAFGSLSICIWVHYKRVCMYICMYIPGTYTYTCMYAFMDIWVYICVKWLYWDTIHVIQFTHLQCTSQWFLLYSQNCAAIKWWLFLKMHFGKCLKLFLVSRIWKLEINLEKWKLITAITVIIV